MATTHLVDTPLHPLSHLTSCSVDLTTLLPPHLLSVIPSTRLYYSLPCPSSPPFAASPPVSLLSVQPLSRWSSCRCRWEREGVRGTGRQCAPMLTSRRCIDSTLKRPWRSAARCALSLPPSRPQTPRRRSCRTTTATTPPTTRRPPLRMKTSRRGPLSSRTSISLPAPPPPPWCCPVTASSLSSTSCSAFSTLS